MEWRAPALPASSARCDIPVVDAAQLNASALSAYYSEPLLVIGGATSWPALRRWRRNWMLQTWGDLLVQLAPNGERVPLSSLAGLAGVRELALYRNRFSGTLPTQLGLLSPLQTLRVEHNRISGTLPTQLAQLTSLRTMCVRSLHTREGHTRPHGTGPRICGSRRTRVTGGRPRRRDVDRGPRRARHR